jgi:hypothetical protein
MNLAHSEDELQLLADVVFTRNLGFVSQKSTIVNAASADGLYPKVAITVRENEHSQVDCPQQNQAEDAFIDWPRTC